jgi:hypothetical protein
VNAAVIVSNPAYGMGSCVLSMLMTLLTTIISPPCGFRQ